MAHDQPVPVLHQFRASHYNDKVRWALAHKGIAHARVSYLPGPHRRAIVRLTGQTSTPVLELDGQVVAGSARIIDLLEHRFPLRNLYPWEPKQLEQALAIQARFDREVGPATRTLAFAAILDDPGYVARLFGHGDGAFKLALYRASLPMLRPFVAKANGVADADNVRRSLAVTEQALDWIAASTRQRHALVGDAFSVADLAAAALLSPVVALDHPDMRPREGVPAALASLQARFEGHPAVSWVKRQYREHRPADVVVG